MIGNKYDFIEAELERRMSTHQMRKLRPFVPVSGVEVSLNGKSMINFCSNDYLGLSKHPLVRERASAFIDRYGAGSTASRLVCGTFRCVQEVEEKLSALKETEGALVFNSGFQANVSVLPALADKGSLILSDELNHNSLIQGALLCRCAIAKVRHNDLEHMRDILKQSRKNNYSRTLIVTESVFSMDGDRCDIDALVGLAEEFDALLVVDEAHATGVLGKRGMGLTCGKNVDLTIGTFSKAGGSFGSYVACSARMRDYLVNRCSGFIYSTALPPSVIGAIDAALDLMPQMDVERRELHHKADFLRTSLQGLGWSTGASSTQIIPVIIGGEEETLALSAYMEERGVLAIGIRPPTVEPGRSRIRVTLSALHKEEHVEYLLELLRKWSGVATPGILVRQAG
jgi:8-amino-7-oxononanoate synthase